MTSLPTRLSLLSFTAMAMIPAAAMANAADEREYLPGNIVVTGDTGSSGWVLGGFDTTYNGAGDAFL